MFVLNATPLQKLRWAGQKIQDPWPVGASPALVCLFSKSRKVKYIVKKNECIKKQHKWQSLAESPRNWMTHNQQGPKTVVSGIRPMVIWSGEYVTILFIWRFPETRVPPVIIHFWDFPSWLPTILDCPWLLKPPFFLIQTFQGLRYILITLCEFNSAHFVVGLPKGIVIFHSQPYTFTRGSIPTCFVPKTSSRRLQNFVHFRFRLSCDGGSSRMFIHGSSKLCCHDILILKK